jgi:hypothetical protein
MAQPAAPMALPKDDGRGLQQKSRRVQKIRQRLRWAEHKLTVLEPGTKRDSWERYARQLLGLLDRRERELSRAFARRGYAEQLEGVAPKGEWKGKPASPDTTKKTVLFQGLEIRVDRPKGFIMRGVDAEGVDWERKYQTDYGYIPKTEGGDGEDLDVFIGPNKSSSRVFWATQVKPNGKFDEYKVFLGYDSPKEARAVYRAHIPSKLLKSMRETSLHMVKALLGQNPKERVEMYNANRNSNPTGAPVFMTPAVGGYTFRSRLDEGLARARRRAAELQERNDLARLLKESIADQNRKLFQETHRCLLGLTEKLLQEAVQTDTSLDDGMLALWALILLPPGALPEHGKVVWRKEQANAADVKYVDGYKQQALLQGFKVVDETEHTDRGRLGHVFRHTKTLLRNPLLGMTLFYNERMNRDSGYGLIQIELNGARPSIPNVNAEPVFITAILPPVS